MNHIAERLRNRNTPYGTIALLDEAANEIDRLTTERGRLRAALANIDAQKDDYILDRSKWQLMVATARRALAEGTKE